MSEDEYYLDIFNEMTKSKSIRHDVMCRFTFFLILILVGSCSTNVYNVNGLIIHWRYATIAELTFFLDKERKKKFRCHLNDIYSRKCYRLRSLQFRMLRKCFYFTSSNHFIYGTVKKKWERKKPKEFRPIEYQNDSLYISRGWIVAIKFRL